MTGPCSSSAGRVRSGERLDDRITKNEQCNGKRKQPDDRRTPVQHLRCPGSLDVLCFLRLRRVLLVLRQHQDFRPAFVLDLSVTIAVAIMAIAVAAAGLG